MIGMNVFLKKANQGIGKWQRVTLSDKESWEVIKESIELNSNIYTKIVAMFDHPEAYENQIDTIFNKCGIKSFTLLKERLDRNVAKMKEGAGK